MRDKAVESLRTVASSLSDKQMEDHFIPMIKRLATGDLIHWQRGEGGTLTHPCASCSY